MTAADRLQRTGAIVTQAQSGVAVKMNDSCGQCTLGCLSRRIRPHQLSIPESLAQSVAANVGTQVSVSVSRSGLTRLALLAFVPILTVLVLVALMADHGFSGGLLLGCGAFMMILAAAISRALVRPRVQRMLSVDARVIVSS